ncbi:hypothetical protein JT358_14500 [Micrococcales bacterium 31B]|nr:hypothetical protein [Micrococcales bacterium 31B]
MALEDFLEALSLEAAGERVLALEGEARELGDAEAGTIEWVDRLRSTTSPIQVLLRQGLHLTGEVGSVADEWFHLIVQPHVEAIVMLNAVVSVRGLSPYLVHSGPGPASMLRLSAKSVLRGFMQAQVPVRLVTAAGEFDCQILKVLADHIDVTHRDAPVHGSGGEVQESLMLNGVYAVIPAAS